MKPDIPVNEWAKRMVRRQIRERGIFSAGVLEAMERIPRELFVSAAGPQAYEDKPLPIGYGQTISQPYMVALMTELLELSGREKVLEIGTGSGYQTAVLAYLSDQVFSVERIAQLSQKAAAALTALGFTNVFLRTGDGSEGLPKVKLFDRILIAAAAPRVPSLLLNALNDNGIMVVPVGDYRSFQTLKVITRQGKHFKTRESIGCRFVPLIGRNGFPEN